MVVARRWSWLVVLLVGAALYEAVRRAVYTTGNPNLLPALILLGAAVVPVAFVAFIAGRRLVFGVGGGTVALTALVGGVVGVVAAGSLEYDTLRRLGVLPVLAVGFIEEAVKLIAPVAWLVLHRRDRHPADGLLLGVASGAGFAVLETMGYGFVVLIRSGGNLGVTEGVLFERGLLSPAAHMAWTGLAAAAVWQAASAGWPGRLAVRALAVFVLVVALHTTWDAAGSLVVYLVVAAVSLGLLVVTAHSLAAPHRRELPAPAQLSLGLRR